MSDVQVGDIIQGTVTAIKNYGAFVRLPNEKEGLVHISQIADKYVTDINDYLEIDQEVSVKVINIKPDGKIGLSIKQVEEEEE